MPESNGGAEWEHAGTAFHVLALVVLAFLIVAPPILIPLGHRALRQGRLPRAGDLATVAGVSAGVLFLLVALMMPWLMKRDGDLDPSVAALLLYPATLWFLARRLARSIRAVPGA